MSVDIQKIKDQVLQYSDQLERVKAEVRKALIGQDLMLSRLLIALLTGGHVLLEGVPGWRQRFIASSTAFSSHRTCCRPT
jgi:MoxR-like ATPase